MDFCLALILYTRYSYFKCAPIKTMRILKFLFLLPLLAIGAQALEPKVVMKPEASLKHGLYYVKGKLYDGTLKMLRYSVEDLYDVNAMGMVYPRLKPLPPSPPVNVS